MNILLKDLSHNTNSEDVLNAIVSELNYQDSTWNENTTSTGGVHTPIEFLVFMQSYLVEAQHLISHNAEDKVIEEVANIVRKITTMGARVLLEEGSTDLLIQGENHIDYSFNELLGIMQVLINQAMLKSYEMKAKGSDKVTLSFISDLVVCAVRTMDSQKLAPLRTL